MTRIPLAVAVTLLSFGIVSTADDFTNVKSTSVNSRSGSVVTVDVERFDPSHCVTQKKPNDWQNLPISPTPYPDLPGQDGILIVQANLTQVQPDLKMRQRWQRNSLRQRNHSKREDPYAYCEQIRSFNFQHASGFVRTKSAPVTESDSHYWLVWNTDHPIKVVIWRSQGSDETYWSKFYASPIGGEDTRGAVQMEGGLAGKFMRVDLSLPHGIEEGVSGEVVLFRMQTRSP